jgi:hypothetical protein
MLEYKNWSLIMIREIVKPKNSNLVINIPNEYIGQGYKTSKKNIRISMETIVPKIFSSLSKSSKS